MANPERIALDIFLQNLDSLNAIGMRSLNRIYLHPQNKRCCSNCKHIYEGIEENFHLKKYDENGKKIFNVWCKTCKNKYTAKITKEYRNKPEQFINSKIAAYKARAKEINVPFDLTTDYLFNQWNNQKGLCFYSGEVIDFNFTTEIATHPHLMTPSLDRMDPKKGYVMGNVVWCAYQINRMKNEFTYDEFIKMCEIIIKVRKENV